MTAPTMTVTTACPPWCARPSDHGLPTRDGGCVRIHLGPRRVIAGAVMELEQRESRAADGSGWLGPLLVASATGSVPLAALMGVA